VISRLSFRKEEGQQILLFMGEVMNIKKAAQVLLVAFIAALFSGCAT